MPRIITRKVLEAGKQVHGGGAGGHGGLGGRGRQAEEAALQYGRASGMAAEQSDYSMSPVAQEPPVRPLLLGVGAGPGHSPDTHFASP